jgi:hypothetical protein
MILSQKVSHSILRHVYMDTESKRRTGTAGEGMVKKLLFQAVLGVDWVA